MDNELNEKMAEMMGWHEENVYSVVKEGYVIYYNDLSNKRIITKNHWHPTTDDSQARMCWEKWVSDNNDKDYRSLIFIEYSNQNYQVALKGKHGISISLQGDRLAETVCQAIQEAMK